MTERKPSIQALKDALLKHGRKQGFNPVIVDAKPSQEGFPAIMIGKVFRIEITDHYDRFYRLYKLTSMDTSGQNVTLGYLKNAIEYDGVHIRSSKYYEYTSGVLRKFIAAGLCTPKKQWFKALTEEFKRDFDRLERVYQKARAHRVKFFGPPEPEVEIIKTREAPECIPDAFECEQFYNYVNKLTNITVDDYCYSEYYEVHAFPALHANADSGSSAIVQAKVSGMHKFFCLCFDRQTKTISVRATQISDDEITSCKTLYCRDLTVDINIETHLKN